MAVPSPSPLRRHFFPRERTGPCVYAYLKGRHALYVGQTGDLFLRLFGHAEVWRHGPTDLFFLPLPDATVDQREAVEGLLIELLRPTLNRNIPTAFSRRPADAHFLIRMALGPDRLVALLAHVLSAGWEHDRMVMRDLTLGGP